MSGGIGTGYVWGVGISTIRGGLLGKALTWALLASWGAIPRDEAGAGSSCRGNYATSKNEKINVLKGYCKKSQKSHRLYKKMQSHLKSFDV